MTGDGAGDAPDVAGWRELCRRLESTGEQLLGHDFPESGADRAEGLVHLAQQVACWLTWSIGYADPLTPAFQRQNDLVTKWGGPNADNVYRHARIDAARRYRIRGRMNSCDDFILAIRAGFMHMERWGTLKEVTASDIGIRQGDVFEILLGSPGADRGGGPVSIGVPEGAAMVSIREYYFDWRPEEPATFTIECLDNESPPPRVTSEAVALRLQEAISGIEHSIGYWNDYLRTARARQPDNTFAPPLQLAKGLEAARYAFCFYRLLPGQALFVESDLPDARYWSLQLYSLAWFEPLDLADRVTSINHAQAFISSDGRLRAVVSAVDPGWPNWLDTEGRSEGLLTYRWFWPTRDAEPQARLVNLDDLDALPPRSTPRIRPDDRRAEIRRRREHLAWRFRT